MNLLHSPHHSVRLKFGKKVKELRMQKNLTQEDFSYLARIDRTYVSSIESGKANISLDAITRIAKALKVSLPELFTF